MEGKRGMAISASRPYLAGGQHVGDGLPSRVGGGDDVVLPTAVAGGHGAGGGLRHRLGGADQLLGSHLTGAGQVTGQTQTQAGQR